jgi:biopolymer transport protein ExbB
MKCYRFSLFGFFLTTIFANAAIAEKSVPAVKEVNFLEILAKGGVIMYPLGLMSVITVLLIIVFLLTIRRNAIVSDRFMDQVESMIGKRDFSGLAALSHRRNECMARITQKTLDFISANPASSFDSVREIAQAEGSHQAGMLTSRITYLSDVGSIAPMVGLLGTVIGMIKAFIEVSKGGQGVREMGLAQGVSEALIATAGGLVICIPALVFYSIFRGRVHKYTSELEAAATHFIAILQPHFQRPSAPVSSSRQVSPTEFPREDYSKMMPQPLVGERPDLHGI